MTESWREPYHEQVDRDVRWSEETARWTTSDDPTELRREYLAWCEALDHRIATKKET